MFCHKWHKNRGNEMVKYTSSKQLSFEDFEAHLGKKLNGQNRWVSLASQIPWDELATIYGRSLRRDFGRPSVDARMVIGAMLITPEASDR